MRAIFAVLALALLANACSDDKVIPPGSEAKSEQILKRDCSDPKWRDQNMGLWYSVCRQPMRW